MECSEQARNGTARKVVSYWIARTFAAIANMRGFRNVSGSYIYIERDIDIDR